MARTTKKRTTEEAPQVAQSENATTTDNVDVGGQTKPAHGAPIEHYRGEPNHGKRVQSAGSLEEETLDRDAPYNRTYGIEN